MVDVCKWVEDVMVDACKWVEGVMVNAVSDEAGRGWM